jgi:hypothetical protein
MGLVVCTFCFLDVHIEECEVERRSTGPVNHTSRRPEFTGGFSILAIASEH